MATTHPSSPSRRDETVVDLRTLSSEPASQENRSSQDKHEMTVDLLNISEPDPQALIGPSLPGAFVGPSLPGAFVGPSLPGAFVGPSLPGASVGPSLPSAFVGPSLPSAFVGPSLPSAFVGPSLPSAIVGPSLPSAFVGPSLPGSSIGPSLPGAISGNQNTASTSTGNTKSRNRFEAGQGINCNTIASAFSSLEEYENEMQKDLNNCGPASRFFFEEDGVYAFLYDRYRGKTGYAKPIQLRQAEGRRIILNCEGDSSGEDQSYYTIICFLFENDAEGVDSIRVNFQSLFIDHVPADGEASFVRVLLRSQTTTELYINLEQLDNSKPGSVQLCYMELCEVAPSRDMYDCIYPALPPRRKLINVWHDDTESLTNQQRSATITQNGYAMSASGSHVATLSRAGCDLHLDLWDMNMTELGPTTDYPLPPTTPVRHSIVDSGSEMDSNIRLSISSNGSQIMVYGAKYARKPLMQLFSINDPCSSPRMDKRSQNVLYSSNYHSQCTELLSFKGQAKFANATQSGWSDDKERFITGDGQKISVYSAKGQWELLYSFYDHQDSVESFRSVSGAAGGVIATNPTFYQIHIWDLDSGDRLQIIDSAHKIWRSFLSSDGRVVGALSNGDFLLYSTETGEILQRSAIPPEVNSVIIQADPGFYGWQNGLPRKLSLLESARSLTLFKSVYLPLLEYDFTFYDIRHGAESQGEPSRSTVFVWIHGSILEASFLEDISFNTDGESACSPECVENLLLLPRMDGKAEFTFPGGTFTINTREGRVARIMTLDIQFRNGDSKAFWWEASEFHVIENQSQLVIIKRKPSWDKRCSIWKLPQSSQECIEMVYSWYIPSGVVDYTMQTCSHGRNLTFSSEGTKVQLFPGTYYALDNAERFANAISPDFWMLEQCQETLHAQMRYLLRHINNYPSPGDQSISVMSRLCLEWKDTIHSEFKAALFHLLHSDTKEHWVPLRSYTKGANPVGIMLGHAKTSPVAIEIVRIIIDYCIQKTNETMDIIYITFLLECIDDLLGYADIALRTTRGFSYVKHHSRELVVNNCKIAHPPTLRRPWLPDTRMIYQCKNPILQMHYQGENTNPLVASFTEEVYIAPINLLWSYVPNPYQPRKEFVHFNPESKMTWFTVLSRLILFNMNPFAHVYVRPRSYSLQILDNPAAEAVIQYKWNTYVFALWLSRFTIHCVYYILIMAAALVQVYSDEPESILGVFVAIVVLSCMFLWFEFLQWRESRYRTQPAMVRENEKSGSIKRATRWILGSTEQTDQQSIFEPHSQYFRSPYNTLDLLMYIYPLGASIHQIISIVLANGSFENNTVADFSFCIVLVFLHMLSELRVSEIVCKYITIVIGILHEIKVFFFVFAGGVFFFSVSILHILHGKAKQSWGSPDVNLPDNFFGAITTGYLMIGGRFDPLGDDMFENGDGEILASYKNWPLQIMVMSYFTFSSILMLNVLIALINVAFVKGDDSWRQVWFENRLRYVESAENMTYHIPGFRESFDWFPRDVYYTATPYQEKQYQRRVKETDEKIIFDEADRELAPKTTNTKDDAVISESPVMISRMEGVEEKLNKQAQDQREGLTTIKERLDQQDKQSADHKDDLKVVKEQLEIGAKAYGVQIDEIRKVAERSQVEISEMRVDNMELKREILAIKGDIHAILAALQGLQNQLQK